MLARRSSPWRTASEVFVGLVLGAASLLLIAWLTLHWGILPHVDEWRPQIENRASKALGVPVRIGRIVVSAGGLVPALQLSDVVLLDADQHEALRLPKVSAAVSLRSLIGRRLRFEQLLIEGASLEVRRDAQGRLHAAGLTLSTGDGPGDGAAADWFFSQREFAVRRGTLRWTDEQRGLPALELRDVDLVFRNGLRRHRMRIDATPPADWGARFSLQGDFTQSLLERSGDWRRWSGTLHGDLPHADLARLHGHLDLPFEFRAGRGAVRAWLERAQGQWTAATVDLALRDLALRLGNDVQPLAFAQADGRLLVQRGADTLSVQAQHFGFVTGDGVAWPQGNLGLVLRRRAQDDGALVLSGGEVNADLLDLALVTRIAAGVPHGEALRRLLADTAPDGQLRNLAARWEGPAQAPARYQLKAQAAGLTVAPAPRPMGLGRPGLRNAEVDLSATERGGTAKLSLAQGTLNFPGVFAQPEVAMDRLSAQLAWRIDAAAEPGAPPAVELLLDDVHFANADVQGEFNAVWRSAPHSTQQGGPRQPGMLDLTGKLAGGRAIAVARYLPLGIPESARRYVEDAVRGGDLGAVNFRVRGDLKQFPFRDAKDGEFRIAGKVQDVTLAYVPGERGSPPPWPVLTQLHGELVFDRASMAVRNARAQVSGYLLTQVNGGIRNLSERPALVIQGQGRGALADGLRYVAASPLAERFGPLLRRLGAGGASELQLALDIPFESSRASTVRGELTLPGNVLRFGAGTPELTNAKARIAFTHEGFTIAEASARALGGALNVEGGSQHDGAMLISARGTATAEALQRSEELGALSRVAASLNGQAAYRLDIHMPALHGGAEYKLESDLAGMGSELPAPLHKRAADVLPLRLQIAGVRGAEAGADRNQDQVQLQLGDLLQAQFVRDLSHDAPRVLRGGIGVSETAPQPASGVAAQVKLARLDVDAWRRWTSGLQASADSAPSSGAGFDAASGGYLPQRVALQADELLLAGRRWTAVAARLARAAEAGRWQAELQADQVKGLVELQPGRTASDPGAVRARLSRLALPSNDAPAANAAPTANSASAPARADTADSIPALDIVINELQLGSNKLGHVEIEGAPMARADGPADWRLARLSADMPQAQLQASGHWSAAQHRMVTDFKLQLADSGALLEQIFVGQPVLRGGKGSLQGQLSWAGSPLSLDLPSMDGQMKLALDQGQFLKADPGAARLLSVLSLQSLTRRLTLDFRDVFQAGFAFDHILGDVSIRDGTARSDNLRMLGPQAAVLMEGSADLRHETQDLRVVVVPQIDAGTASLAYAVINPAVGLGTFLAQMFLRKPMMQAATREFHVSGGWADPKVEQVERAFGKPLPEIDAPGAESASAPAAADARPPSPTP